MSPNEPEWEHCSKLKGTRQPAAHPSTARRAAWRLLQLIELLIGDPLLWKWTGQATRVWCHQSSNHSATPLFWFHIHEATPSLHEESLTPLSWPMSGNVADPEPWTGTGLAAPWAHHSPAQCLGQALWLLRVHPLLGKMGEEWA